MKNRIIGWTLGLLIGGTLWFFITTNTVDGYWKVPSSPNYNDVMRLIRLQNGMAHIYWVYPHRNTDRIGGATYQVTNSTLIFTMPLETNFAIVTGSFSRMTMELPDSNSPTSITRLTRYLNYPRIWSLKIHDKK